MKLRKNDKVKVIRGKDKGKESVVELVINKTNKVYVKDVNVFKKHMKGRGIIDLVKPLQASHVQVICPKCNEATRIGYKIEDTKKTRVCKKCQGEL
jgi:large subunit ribosomal protein L24